jgi:RNA polymerase sigma factor (sigma-70 family)
MSPLPTGIAAGCDVTIFASRENLPELMNDPLSDQELVRRAKAGDLSEFEALASRYERRIYTVARRITGNESDAEDVTQQAFLSAIEGLENFREEAGFATWLQRIATHAALKVLRKRKGLLTVSLEASTELQYGYDTVPHPEYIADWRESPEKLVGRNETNRLNGITGSMKCEELLAMLNDYVDGGKKMGRRGSASPTEPWSGGPCRAPV